MNRALPCVAFAFALMLAAPAALADATPRTLTVNGTGEMRAAPDQAQLSTGVVTQATTAAAALAANSRAMNAVFDTLKRAGIAEKNIQTSNFSVSPQYASAKPGSALAHLRLSGLQHRHRDGRQARQGRPRA